MTKLSQACKPLRSIPGGIGTAIIRARGIAETAWSFLKRMLSARNAFPNLTEWDNDVPPTPIFAGEVARAEASLSSPTRRHQHRLAA
jgi:hypothetical protein